MGKSCTGFGHKDIIINLAKEMDFVVRFLIYDMEVDTFYVGKGGDFNRFFARSVIKAREKRPNISLILVVPSDEKFYAYNRDYYIKCYDKIVFYEPEKAVQPDSVFYAQNCFMVDQSDFVISCFYENSGEAYEAISYAKKQNKTVIPIEII